MAAPRRPTRASGPAIPARLLLVCDCPAEDSGPCRALGALARGLQTGGREVDLCLLEKPGAPGELAEQLARVDFDRRMRGARALIVLAERLHESALAGSVAFETASRARQAGVPAYAVTAQNHLSPFDARILDLQLVLEAVGTRALAGAGRRLAALV